MNWNENGLKTLDDIEIFESQGKKTSVKNNEHSYDLDKFEALAVGASPRKE